MKQLIIGIPQKRRMGVALAAGRDTNEARTRAKSAASKVVPVKA